MSYPQEHLKNSTQSVNNDAQFISQSDIPSSMRPGERATVSITMKNTGTTTWTEAGQYRLGSQNPQDNVIWGTGRIYLSPEESIAPGQQKTFTFEIIAPSTPRTYNFQWRMLQELVEWFGDFTPNLQIIVGDAGRVRSAMFVAQSGIPTSMRPGERATVSITMKNTGTTTWTEAGQYRLGSQNPQDNVIWGTGRIYLSPEESIAPGQQKTFTFEIIAPSTPDPYNFQWRMVQDGVEWFGDFTPNVPIAVAGRSTMFDRMILSADDGKFVRERRGELVPINFRGAISCCGGGYGWPLFNEEWVDYVKAQGNVNFLHARLGPFLAEAESEWTKIGGGYFEVNGKADLTKWNDRFWQRIREVIEYAGTRGIWVEVDVIDGWYWKQKPGGSVPSPWHADRNLQGEDWTSRHRTVNIEGDKVYEEWVRKVVKETGRYGNVVYQDGNEIGLVPNYDKKWSISISKIIHNEEERNGYLRHLVGTNSGNVDTMKAVEIDYIEFHSDDAPDPTFGKPTGSNEYNPDPPLTPEDLHRRYCDGRRKGTYFWYWRHGQSKPEMDRTLELIKGGCASLGNGAQFVSQSNVPTNMRH